MNRLDIIKHLARINDADSYLEIGVEQGLVFNNIPIKYKVGVDPDKQSKATVICSSDDFFANNTQFFDIIFIDGLHHADQVQKDIINSLKILTDNGYIICHDMLPKSKKMEMIPRQQYEWTGDCWKAWVNIRQTRSDLSMYVVDTDYGCGIIHKGNQNLLNITEPLEYENFCKNKHDWMNIISIQEFKELFI